LATLFRDDTPSAAQAVELTNGLKALNAGHPLPLFIAADEEGGRVRRLPSEATAFPPAWSVGRSASALLARQIGQAMGEELQALGINVDLAPVLDVNTNPLNPVIGDRSFGDDPALVETMGAAVMQGLQPTGTITAVKHFPGQVRAVGPARSGGGGRRGACPALAPRRRRGGDRPLKPCRSGVQVHRPNPLSGPSR
jgi:beta-N-acetylhexosaminidase